ncbi:MAG: hypothetical protein ACUVT0_08070 [Thermochromatium sp.]
MPEANRPQSTDQSFWKLIALVLMLALVGVYILYEWYDDRLYEQIAEKDALIVQLSDRLKETEARRLAALEGWNASRGEIEALKEQFQTEKRDLNDQIRMLEEIKMGLGQDIEGIKAAHAAVLAEERRKTAEAVAEKERLIEARNEIQAQLEAEREKVASLKVDLSRVNQAIAEAVTSHQRRITELERHLNERVSLARTTPEDAEVLRTIQELGVLSTPTGRTAEAQALADELANTRSQLERLSTEHESLRAQLAESQAELQQARLELELSRRAAAQADRALEQLAKLEAELNAERAIGADWQRRYAEAIATQEAALAERDRRLTELQAALEQARARLSELQQVAEAATQDDHQALLKAQTRIAVLKAELAQARLDDQAQSEALAEAQTRLASLTAELEQASMRDSDGTDQALNAAQSRIQALEAELETVRQSLASATASDQCQAADELARLRARYAGFAQLNGTFTERGLLLRLAESELHFPTGQPTLPGKTAESRSISSTELRSGMQHASHSPLRKR